MLCYTEQSVRTWNILTTKISERTIGAVFTTAFYVTKTTLVTTFCLVTILFCGDWWKVEFSVIIG